MVAPRNPLSALFRWSVVGPEDISQDPTKSLLSALGSTPTASGVSVNEENAEGLPAVYAAVHVLADTIAAMPLKLMRRREDGALDEATDHPLYDVLMRLANPETSAFECRDVLQTSLALWGNAYAEVVRNARGQVEAMWPLDPARMDVGRNELNELRYVYRTTPTATPRSWVFDPNRPPVLHLKINVPPGGSVGRSPIRMHREALGLARAADDFGARFFANQARPSGVLQTPNRLTPEGALRLKESWESAHRSINQHRTAVLEEGVTWQQITIPPEDAQFIETRKYQLDEVARIYRIPPHMLGAVDRSTSWGSGIEQQVIGFKTFTLLPWLVRWKQAIARDLLNRQEWRTYELVWDTAELLRGDAASRAQAFAVMRQNGVISANEWRQADGLDPISEDDGGDTYLVNGNMIPAKAAEDQARAQLAAAEALAASADDDAADPTPGTAAPAGTDDDEGDDE